LYDDGDYNDDCYYNYNYDHDYSSDNDDNDNVKSLVFFQSQHN